MADKRAPSSHFTERQKAGELLGSLPTQIASWNDELARLQGHVVLGRYQEGQRTRVADRLLALERELLMASAALDASLATQGSKLSRVEDAKKAMAHLIELVGALQSRL